MTVRENGSAEASGEPVEGPESNAESVLTLEDHLRIIRDWQRESGEFGRCPPKAQFPKTSNFVQWARKRVRDAGDRKYELALASVGIDSEKVRPDAGLAGACAAVLRFVDVSGRPPELDSADRSERHVAAWLVRMQSGILPRNHLEARADGPVSQMMQEVVTKLEACQSDCRLAAQWFELCARTHDLLPRLNKGNTWGSRLSEAPTDRMALRYAWLQAAKRSISPKRGYQIVRSPDPLVVIAQLNARLERMVCPVSFSTEREATTVFRTRLERCGVLESELGIETWAARKGLPG